MNAAYKTLSTNPFIINRIFPYLDPHAHGLPVAAQLKHFNPRVIKAHQDWIVFVTV